MSKLKVGVVSDLYGVSQSDWWSYYTILFSNHDVTIFDSRNLASISSELSKEDSHDLFIKAGIEKAALKLANYENFDVLIGLSVGGVIGWRAIHLGLSVNRYLAVSATRLRYENEIPQGDITLLYGESDPYKPDDKWATDLKVNMKIIPNADHNIYMQSEFIEKSIMPIALKSGS